MEPLDLCWWHILIYSLILALPVVYIIRHFHQIIHSFSRLFRQAWHSLSYSFLLMVIIVCIFIVGMILMAQAFNGFIPYFTTNTLISKKMEDWGDFATFFGGFFALISILIAYRAFISQVNASRRASFDITFTQIFAQHHVLYDKAVNHKVYIGLWDRFICNICNKSHNVFTLCREEYEKSGGSVLDFWERFNRNIGLEASADFRNFFKYIYHEVNIVLSQPEEFLSHDMKRQYIHLIQSQMNNEELFCYLINQMVHIRRIHNEIAALMHNTDGIMRSEADVERVNSFIFDELRRVEQYAYYLYEYTFFEELCKNTDYRELISMIFFEDFLYLRRFVWREWLP